MTHVKKTDTLEEKKEQLLTLLKEYLKEDVCVAFSGGVDSSLLLVMASRAARERGRKVYAITMDTVLHPSGDLGAARKVLEGTGAEHVILKLNELAVPEMKNNPVNRCYLCKKALYEQMLSFGEKKGIHTLIEGSNEDDLHVYRPGLTAVKELGVKSPLAYLHITKEEVRSLAREYGIPVADRPSSPCLATRLPYGTEIDLELLNRTAFVAGRSARLKDDGIHVSITQKFRDEYKVNLKELVFPYITLDLEGFRSGSMDQIQTRDNSEI